MQAKNIFDMDSAKRVSVMKTGIKIVTNIDKTIAELICSCKSGADIVSTTGLGSGTVHNRIASWKKYYGVRDYSGLVPIMRMFFEQAPVLVRPPSVYDNKQYGNA